MSISWVCAAAAASLLASGATVAAASVHHDTVPPPSVTGCATQPVVSTAKPDGLRAAIPETNESTCTNAVRRAHAPTVAKATAPHLVRKPVVTYRASGNAVTAYLRFDRSLPLKRAGGRTLLRIQVAVPGAPDVNSTAIGDNALNAGRRGRGCYSSDQLTAVKRPRAGAVVRLRIGVGPRARPLATLTVSARLRPEPKHVRRQSDDPILRRLGCVGA